MGSRSRADIPSLQLQVRYGRRLARLWITRAALARALDHVLALTRRGALPALPQLLTTLLGQLLELAEIVAVGLLARGRQRAEIFPALPQLLAALLGQFLKLIEALTRLSALVGRHAQPTLTAAGERLLALRSELVPLSGQARHQPLLIGRQ